MQTAPEIVIEAGGRNAQYWRDLWRYRELFYLLAWRDLLVRYKQTVAGVGWALFRPLASMLVFVFVFRKLAGLPSGEVPYPLMVLAGLLPWQFFSNALSDSGNSLLNNSNLISKIFFPRMIVPASAVITTFADFLIAGALTGGVMIWYGFFPDARVLVLPVLVLWAVMLTLGVALWLSALTVKFRDMRFVIPFFVQFGFFISPVGYVSSVVPDQWRLLYFCNPVAGLIDAFRWSLLRPREPLYVEGILTSILISLFLAVLGFHYFRKTERSFADVI